LYNDPLADATACKRDIPLLQELGVNTIRTYNIDPTQDHSVCMGLLDAAGIYLISDLAEPSQSIDRSQPTWDLDLYSRYTDVVDSLAKYSNVIGFFAGNEVTNNNTNTPASAFVKAAVRDTKAYVKSKGYTTGVGYAADDDKTVRADVAAYFNCGDAAESIDFWGYNIYSWCDPSDFVTSLYQQHTEEFSTYNVPVFFAEYGCNQGSGDTNGAAGRDFSEVPVLYGPQMNGVFSGGIVYEYFEEANDYGLVSVTGDDSVSKLADFASYSSRLHAVSPTLLNSAKFTPTNTALQACPTVTDVWQVAPSGLPPTPDKDVCTCMTESLTCVAKSNLSGEALGELFGSVCTLSPSACSGFAFDTSKASYGAYLGCSAQDKLSLAFNSYYLAQKSNPTACDFSGNATVVKAAGAASSCKSLIASASQAAATGGGGPGLGSAAGSTSSSGGSSPTTSNSKNAGVTMHASLSIGMWCWAGYFATAILSGAGILLL
jgi:hypothetical protein